MATVHELRAMLAAHQASVHQTAALATTVRADELQRPDALQIDWRDVLRVLEDVRISVTNEGQFSSPKVREALQLVELAISTLTRSAHEAEQRLERSDLTFFDYVIALFPNMQGARARRVIAGYRRDNREVERLSGLITAVSAKRVEIAQAIDHAIDASLLANSDGYRALDSERAKHEERHKSAKEMCMHAESVFERSQLAAYTFYVEHGCRPELPALNRAEDLEHCRKIMVSGIKAFLREAESAARQAEARMRAMRDELKAKIYGDLDESG